MIACLSASHKKASLPMLESLNIPNQDALMKSFYSDGLVQECVLLQTCHRVEIYCVLGDPDKNHVTDRILKSWSAKAGISFDLLSKIVEVYEGKEALTHLFNLASGLESMVLGEDQIVGQVRLAYVKAKKLGLAGLILEKVFMKAVNTGRRIRTETAINEGSVSISSVAVDLAEKDLGAVSSLNTLVIGAGDTGSIVAGSLKKRRAKRIFVANRTFERGSKLASMIGGKAVRFNHLWQVLPKVDLVIVAVSVDKPLIKFSRMKRLLVDSGLKKKFYLVDISQPRAVEEKIGSLTNVTLRNIDDLKAIAEENLKGRQGQTEKARAIILEELERFERQLAKLFVEPMISKICRKAEVIRLRELGRAINRMRESNEKKLMIMDRFSRELIERVLQIPIEQLRGAALKNNGSLLSAAEELFGIKEGKGTQVV